LGPAIKTSEFHTFAHSIEKWKIMKLLTGAQMVHEKYQTQDPRLNLKGGIPKKKGLSHSTPPVMFVWVN